MKKSERADLERRTEELNRIAAVDEENVRLRLQVADLNAEVARLRREAAAEKEARIERERRLVWIQQLSGKAITPSELQ